MILAQNYSQLTLRNTPHTKIHPYTRYKKWRVAHAPGMPERFPRHRFLRKPLVIDPGMHHSTCVTHVPWCMSGSLTRGGEENVPSIPGACAIRNFTYLVRAPYYHRREEGCCRKSTILSQHCIVTFGWCHISFVFFHSSALDSVNNTDDIVYLHASCF